MKPLLEKIVNKPSHSFGYKTVAVASRPILKGAWHYHPELEITLTLKGNGKRFVGNNVSDYVIGDLVLLGSNTPHCWTTNEFSEQIVIQFEQNFLGAHLWCLPETRSLSKLLDKSINGLHFYGDTQKKASKIIIKMKKLKGFQKILKLLELLTLFSKSKDFDCIQLSGNEMTTNTSDLERIQVVYDYIFQNHRSHISLDEIASTLSLTNSSFCRFIKNRTRKTFIQIVNEIKISTACKLLMEKNNTISQVCYEIGFNDISYFNRTFKKYMNCTPSEYKGLYE